MRRELHPPSDDDDESEEEEDTETQNSRKQKRKTKKKTGIDHCPPTCFTLCEEEIMRFIHCLIGVKFSNGYAGKISRYLDEAKQHFSRMKSHNCVVLMTQILPVAIRGIMDEHVRKTLFGLCNFFDVISQKSICATQLKRLQEEIVLILCELEIYFPPSFFDIMVHLLIHVAEDIVQLGSAFLRSVVSFERKNGHIKKVVRNRFYPDASIAEFFLTEECISFCTNYLNTENPVGLPVNKQFGRIDVCGHREGSREMHVSFEGRGIHFERASLVALQHIQLVNPWIIKHKDVIRMKYNDQGLQLTDQDPRLIKEHNSSFMTWFRDELRSNPPRRNASEEEKMIFTLSQGAACNLMTYQAYVINGYTFYTEEKNNNCDYRNSGVTGIFYTDDVKERFYGRIKDIWDLDYCREKVSMFRVRWDKSVVKGERYFTTMVIPEAKSKSEGENFIAS